MDFTTRDYRRLYADFVRYERAAGGPDPHMTLAGALSEGEAPQERAWRLMCYLAAYNVPTGVVLWTEWPWRRVLEETIALEPWIREHWAGLAFRRERRAVRTSTKLAAHLVSCAQFVERGVWFGWSGVYDEAWKDALAVYGTGRYIGIKLLEGLRRFAGAPVVLSDLRARGGSSPREALALLYPTHADALLGDDRREHLDRADMCGAWAREELAEQRGLSVTWYELQSTLCEWKQSVIGRSQYPGRAQDSELAHYGRVAGAWNGRLAGPLIEILHARARLFPEWALGERNGWDGRRDELGPLLDTYGYTWSDSLYDYQATLQSGDWANPVRRAG